MHCGARFSTPRVFFPCRIANRLTNKNDVQTLPLTHGAAFVALFVTFKLLIKGLLKVDCTPSPPPKLQFRDFIYFICILSVAIHLGGVEL